MTGIARFDGFERVPGTRKRYRLTAPLLWDVSKKGSNWTLILPPGTEFDISVPWCLEWVLDPHDRAVLPAAAIHDELLIRGHDPSVSSAEFRRAAVARGCSRRWGWVLFFSTLLWTAFGK
ncbi:conserved hypothetical protein [Roseibium sp. TrichSKD4]|uniref:DUF1353 domain-containing protein n=1 Tax=Roseibium sp. TrichSKD4 TaxID=744980 RepID=UPI0001E56331|nr:DUF1353 domain-containing protein [Roseibium sp. TrichSKD4]EFO33889.1 conserved hypothetical protein [Roseibium sp. TrichSKD4]